MAVAVLSGDLQPDGIRRRRLRRAARGFLACLALASPSRAQASGAEDDAWRRFLSVNDPAFAAYPARSRAGAPGKLVFTGANRAYRQYRTVIAEEAAEGANFAGDHALVGVGCGSGCATAFDVRLHSGVVKILPTGWFANDLDFMNRPTSRYLKVVYRRVRGREERCVGQAYVWTGSRLAPVGPELSRPPQGLFCEGFDRPRQR